MEEFGINPTLPPTCEFNFDTLLELVQIQLSRNDSNMITKGKSI